MFDALHSMSIWRTNEMHKGSDWTSPLKTSSGKRSAGRIEQDRGISTGRMIHVIARMVDQKPPTPPKSHCLPPSQIRSACVRLLLLHSLPHPHPHPCIDCRRRGSLRIHSSTCQKSRNPNSIRYMQRVGEWKESSHIVDHLHWYIDPFPP